MRILALDVGDRTIGVAVSDELGIASHPVTVIRRTSLDADLRRLEELIAEYEPSELVVGPSGYPYTATLPVTAPASTIGISTFVLEPADAATAIGIAVLGTRLVPAVSPSTWIYRVPASGK